MYEVFDVVSEVIGLVLELVGVDSELCDENGPT